MNENGVCLSRYVLASEPLSVPRRGFQGYMLYSTRTDALLTVSEATWQRLRQDRIGELPSEVRRELERVGMLVAKGADELSAVLDENRLAIERHDVLYQVVQPSAWCQLDCDYCGQSHRKASLSTERQEKFLQRVGARLAAGKYRHLQIGWFGAEPLAGMSVIRSMTTPLRELAERHRCSYGARIVTNGLALTPSLAIELSTKLGIDEAEVTLDGLASDHDRLRPTKGGRGSFDRILRNVTAVARTTPLALVVRCNVGQSNVDAVEQLIQKLADAGLAGRVRFYTSPVYSWGNDAHEGAMTPEHYAAAELNWLAQQVRLGFDVGLLPKRRPIVCMAVQRDAEVVDAFGNTYNCTEAPYVPAYGDPNVYSIQVVRNGAGGSASTAFVPGRPAASSGQAYRLASFNDQIRSGEQAPCRACPMLPVCGGQCPKAWHESHEPCPSAKINIAQRLAMLMAMNQLAEPGPQT